MLGAIQEQDRRRLDDHVELDVSRGLTSQTRLSSAILVLLVVRVRLAKVGASEMFHAVVTRGV